MKKIIILTIVAILVLPIMLSAKVTYLSYEDYKKLSKKERTQYLADLQNNLAENQQRKADALAQQENLKKEIADLKAQISSVEKEYSVIYNKILVSLNVSPDSKGEVQTKIDYFNSKLKSFENLSDNELWKSRRNFKAIVNELKEYRKTNKAKMPDFRKDFSDLDNKIAMINTSIQNAKPKYYEEEYTVQSGDYLSKISGYKFIYGDPSKWGIIYRANRDQIKDPNILSENQVIKIPRGLPNSWKVYKGEFLWKIASYPEVYGNGAKWPLIFRANKDQIKDPNLIYPNQVFEIPRD
jgi:nucleoid-associated protein YgaU